MTPPSPPKPPKESPSRPMIVVGALAVILAVVAAVTSVAVFDTERAIVYGLGSVLLVLGAAPIAGFVMIAVSNRAKPLGLATGLLLGFGFSVLGLGGLCFKLLADG